MVRFLKISSVFLLVCLGLFEKNTLFAQQDTEFWFVAPDVYDRHNSDIMGLPIKLDLTNFNDHSVQVEISQPANSGFAPIRLTLAANQSQAVDLSDRVQQVENKPANRVNPYGILVTASDKITAYYEVNLGLKNAEIYSLKGKNALGKEFYIPGQNRYRSGGCWMPNYVNGDDRPRNKFDIVATEDDTRVTISPSQGYIGGSGTINVTLNRGQTYSVVAASQQVTGHLHGSRISSDKPIAVTVSDDLIGGNNDDFDKLGGLGTASDLVGDQIVPTDITGNEFIVIKGYFNESYGKVEAVYITGITNGTQVTMVGANVATATINAGQTKEFNFANNSNTIYIKSSSPIYVYQLTGYANKVISTEVGNEAGSALLPQIICTGSQKVAYRRCDYPEDIDPNDKGQHLYVNIIIKTGYEGGFTFDGRHDIIQASAFKPVAGTNGDWVYASVDVDRHVNFSRYMLVENEYPFHMAVFDHLGGGCSYSYFSNYGKTINLKAMSNHEGLQDVFCEGDTIRLSYTGSDEIEKIVWKGPNGYLNKDKECLFPSAELAHSGTYMVTGETSIPGCEVDTAKINVTVLKQPEIELGDPITSCEAVTLDATCDGAKEYLWSTGEKTPSIQVTESGMYSVRVKNGICEAEDSVQVTVNQPFDTTINKTICEGEYYQVGEHIYTETGNYIDTFVTAQHCDSIIRLNLTVSSLKVNLGDNQRFCSDDFVSLVLDPMVENTGSMPVSYLWKLNDKEVSREGKYLVQVQGDYSMRASNGDGCSDSDRVLVEIVDNPKVAVRMQPEDFCENNNAELLATSDIPDVLWSWNTGETSDRITVTSPGMYTVTADNNGCTGTAHFNIAVCPCNVWFPNAFTPNEDGINDLFGPIISSSFVEYEFIIFNRWGGRVFATNDPTEWWDGRIHGQYASVGVYYFTLFYTCESAPEMQQLKHGSITLIR